MKVETIAEQLLFTTIMIEGYNANGSKSIGTRFIFNHAKIDNEENLFLITNRHVIEGTILKPNR